MNSKSRLLPFLIIGLFTLLFTITNSSGLTSPDSVLAAPDAPNASDLTIDDVTLSEGNSGTVNFVFTVTLNPADPVNIVTVEYTTNDVTATAGSDYTTTSGTLTFNPNDTSHQISVPVIGDAIYESTETFTVDLSNPINATNSDSQGLGTITNDDSQPTISILDVSHNEGNAGTTNYDFNVSLSNPSYQVITVHYATTNGTATAPSDYTSKSDTLTFNPGASTNQNITVLVNGDTTFETTETFTVDLDSPTNATISDPQGLGTITNDDSQPTISINDVPHNEGNAGTTNYDFNVSLSNPSSQVITVHYATTNGTATAPSDYTSKSGTLTFNPGASTNQNITVLVNGDTTFETTETFTVDLDSPTNASILDPQGIGTITNDDAQPTVSFTSASQSQGEAGGSMTITAQLDTTSGLDVTIPYTVGGTATGGGIDYSISPASQVIITAGNLSADITITVVNDTLYESSETVIITMGTPTNATKGSPSIHTATITDNDAQPTVSFTSASQSGGEGVGFLTVTAQLNTISGLDVTVPFTVGGTATGGGIDYSISPASQVIITAGSLNADITITIVDDALPESDETVIITMGIPTNATATGITQHTATITDNDGQPTVSFTSASQSLDEAGGSMTITAQLNTTSGLDVIVPYTVSGTATGGGIDYSISPTSPITITAGTLSTDITIFIVNDTLPEGDETVIVTMGTPTNATATGITQHTATITDNDGQPTVSFTSASQSLNEAGISMTVTAQLNTSSGLNVTVPYTVGGTATGGGTDYSISPTSPITITAGTISTNIIINIVDDSIIEGNETVIVTMGTPTNATATGITQHTATIIDNDLAEINAIPTSGALSLLTSENGLTDTFTVTLTSQPSANVTVSMASDDLSEGFISDPVGNLIFTSSNWSIPRTVTVTGMDDVIVDGSQDYNINLSASSSDSNFNGVTASVPAINADNDTAGLAVSPTSNVKTSEGGKSAKINVLLNTQPSGTVTIAVNSSKTTEGTVSPASLTFTSANWNIIQSVTVTGVDDISADGDKAYYVLLAASSSDPEYEGKQSIVPITNQDAPTIEWVLPAGDDQIYYFTSDSDPIPLKVQSVGNEPIDNVDFYRWDHVLLTQVDIDIDTNAPFETTLDPKSLYFEFNQVFAAAYSPQGVASINVRVLPFRKYVLFMPIVYRNH